MLNAHVGGTEGGCVEMTPLWLGLGSKIERTWGTGTGHPQVPCSCLLRDVCIHICASQLESTAQQSEHKESVLLWSHDGLRMWGADFGRRWFFFSVINPNRIFRKAIKVLVSSLLSRFLLQADSPKQDTCMYVYVVPKRFRKRIPRVKPKEFLTDLRNVTLTLFSFVISD